MARQPGTTCQPVGEKEIAERLGVSRKTVEKWRDRDVMPQPRWTVGGRPAWNWPDIWDWAVETGRDTPPQRRGAR